MNHSGDAAEQIVRMSLEGVEVAARITGTAAKEIAILLIAALKNKNSTLKPKGKARLTSMLKSGKPLEIFSVKESDLKSFAQGAKQYGIVYCALRNTKNSPDGLCDILVKADDAPKISRLVERFKFATVDRAKIESEIVASKTEKAAEATVEGAPSAEPEAPDVGDTEKLLDDLLGTDEGKSKPDALETVKTEPETPDAAKDSPFFQEGRKIPPSEPTSESRSKSAKGTLNKDSVRKELREIAAEKKKTEAAAIRHDERPAADKATTSSTTHKQLTQKGKSKSKKTKGSR